jgi:RNA polymerase sigma factor (sigma-70 family)
MYYQLMTDEALIESYLKGDQASLEFLIHRHKKRIYSYIQMLVCDEPTTDDIFQETFIRVIHSFRTGAYKDEKKFISWVLRIAHNLVIDGHRLNRRIPIHEVEDEYSFFATLELFDTNEEDRILAEEFNHDVWSLIEHLPFEHQEIIILRHFYELSFKEIAERINVNINTATGRMLRALSNLRKLMEKHNMVPTLD